MTVPWEGSGGFHDLTGRVGPGQEVFEISRVGSGRVGSGRIGSDRAKSSWVGPGGF